VLHPIRCVGLAALWYNNNIAAPEQYCCFVSVSVT